MLHKYLWIVLLGCFISMCAAFRLHISLFIGLNICLRYREFNKKFVYLGPGAVFYPA